MNQSIRVIGEEVTKSHHNYLKRKNKRNIQQTARPIQASEEITGNEITQTIEKKTENERFYCRAISVPAWQGLNKPKQATPSPTVEMFCVSVGTWVCTSATNILNTKIYKGAFNISRAMMFKLFFIPK